MLTVARVGRHIEEVTLTASIINSRKSRPHSRHHIHDLIKIEFNLFLKIGVKAHAVMNMHINSVTKRANGK